MERHPVALAVDDNRAKTKGADGMFWLNDSAAVDRNASQRVIQPAVGIEIDHDAFVRRLFLLAREETTADLAVLMREDADGGCRKFLLFHLSDKQRGIKLDCPVQIQHRNVAPNDLIGHLRRFSVSLSSWLFRVECEIVFTTQTQSSQRVCSR